MIAICKTYHGTFAISTTGTCRDFRNLKGISTGSCLHCMGNKGSGFPEFIGRRLPILKVKRGYFDRSTRITEMNKVITNFRWSAVGYPIKTNPEQDHIIYELQDIIDMELNRL